MEIKIKINEDQLRQKIAEVVRDAAWFRRHGGEIQLYGRHDEKGDVYEFFAAEFVGHNSWVQGENIIRLYTCKWFDPMEGEYLPEWLEGELMGRDELLAEFVEHLKAEDLNWQKPHKEWDEFARIYPDTWDEYMEKWREIWLEQYIDVIVDEAINRIAEYEEIELV